MTFNKGDIVFDKTTNDTDLFRYCLVVEQEEHKVWGYWSKTLEDLKNNKYTDNGTMWCEYHNLVRISSATLKQILQSLE